MRKIILLLALTFSITATFAQKGKYAATLVKVEVASGAAAGAISENSYQDSIIKIDWTLGNTEYNFVLHNQSNQTIKIIWDDAAYIGANGETEKTLHAGVKFIDRNNSQVPTSIIRGSKISDLIAPTSKVYYNSGTYSSGWQQKLLYGYSRKTGPSSDGTTTKILLPVSAGEKTIEYLFEFKVTWRATAK